MLRRTSRSRRCLNAHKRGAPTPELVGRVTRCTPSTAALEVKAVFVGAVTAVRCHIVDVDTRSAAYADYDRDGDLDILLTENNGPAHLWRNDQDGGRFLRVRLEGRQSNRDA